MGGNATGTGEAGTGEAGAGEAGTGSVTAAAVYTFDDYRLDPQRRLLSLRNTPVALADRVMRVLIALVEHRDRVVSKEELIRRAWPRTVVVENSLPVAILALRHAFGDRLYVHTVYGKGYRFAAPVAVEDAAVPPGTPPELPGLAVLPFEGGDAANEHVALGHGIAADLIGALSRNRWLRVIARNSSFAVGAVASDAGHAARRLGVRYVLEGSIRSAGGRVRVTARLTDAAAQTHLLSEQYEREIADFFTLQDEITGRIARAVRPVLFEAERARSFRLPPDSMDAWSAYQRGSWCLGRWGDVDLQEAAGWLERAMVLDPHYAASHHGMSRLLCTMGSAYSPLAPPDWQPRAERLAEEAVRLDPRDSAAHVALAWARYMRGHRAGAVAAANDALSQNAGDATAYAALGAALVFDGRAVEGVEALGASIDLDPRDPRIRIRQMQIGLGLWFMREHAAAEAHAAFLIETWPGYEEGHRLRAMVLMETGRAAEALASLHRCVAINLRPFDDLSNRRMPWYRPADFTRMTDGFRRIGWTGSAA